MTHEELQNGTNVFHAAPDPEGGATTSNDANPSGKPCTHQWRIIDLEDCKPSEWEMEDNLLGMTTDITELVYAIRCKMLVRCMYRQLAGGGGRFQESTVMGFGKFY